jgi:hypothetical protein
MRDLMNSVLDVWSPLSHKYTMRARPGEPEPQKPGWMSQADWRRLCAYRLRFSYLQNVSREYIGAPLDNSQSGETERDDFREYGDANLIISQAVAAVLGDDQQIVVDGADQDTSAKPKKSPEERLAEAQQKIDAQNAKAAQDAQFAKDVAAGKPTAFDKNGQPMRPDQFAPKNDGQPVQSIDEVKGQIAAEDRQDWLREWADKEKLPQVLLEGERNSVGLGDNVYVLSWDSRKNRVRITPWDPGFYFPVLDADETDFPDRVHLFWEEEVEDGPRPQDTHTVVRRKTWEIGPISPVVSAPEQGVVSRLAGWLADSGTATDEALFEGDTREEDGTITRRYPWQEQDEDPSNVTCYYTEATWDTRDLKGKWSVDDMPMEAAQFGVSKEGEPLNHVDLFLDFVPVVHVPNNVALQQTWGNASHDYVMQLLDDLSGTDTDLQAAGATTGSPILTLANVAAGAEIPDVGPGAIFKVGEGGSMTALDTSANLGALSAMDDRLLERLSVNSRLPAVALGRVNSANIPSGISLTLTFSPMKTMVQEMRLVRKEKYALVLKFVQRMAQTAGELEAGATPRAELVFGSFMPADTSAAITDAAKGVAGHVISLRTALLMMQESGVPIDDLAEEIDRIKSEDTAAARNVFEATGNSIAAAQRLQVDPPPPAGPQQITVQTNPGGSPNGVPAGQLR